MPGLRRPSQDKIKEFLARTAASPHPEVLVIDAPLLIEVGLHTDVDELWVVKIDEDKQIERLSRRDGLSPEEIRSRIAAQLPPGGKTEICRPDHRQQR